MANLPVAKSTPAVAAQTTWDPFRMMREMLAWDPFREMPGYWMDERLPVQAFSPAFEVKETPHGFYFKADVPGVRKEDLEISCQANRLTISGKREAEKKEERETYYAYERSYGSFTRSFTLPAGADVEHIHAKLHDGVLTIAIPKKAEAQAKKVQIQAADKATPKS